MAEAPPEDPVSIRVDHPGWEASLDDPAAIVRTAARASLALACPTLAEPAGIAVLLTGDGPIQDLNRDWRNQDKPTNVLSFPATETRAGEVPEPEFAGVPLELGDLALAFETCAREAEELGRPLADHLSHLVCHGVLHLIGYDHLTDDEAAVMEGLETRILAGLSIADPYGPHR